MYVCVSEWEGERVEVAKCGKVTPDHVLPWAAPGETLLSLHVALVSDVTGAIVSPETIEGRPPPSLN